VLANAVSQWRNQATSRHFTGPPATPLRSLGTRGPRFKSGRPDGENPLRRGGFLLSDVVAKLSRARPTRAHATS
jgi:hypothetical protein